VEVPTASGASVDASELGFTLLTEHIFLIDAETRLNWPERFGDVDARVDDAVAKLEEAARHGVRTLVDRTMVGIGRDVALVKRVAERSPVNVLVCTGLYTWSDLPLHVAFRAHGRQFEGRREQIEDFMIRDLEEGIPGTGVRAAVIKCVADAPGITPGVEEAIRAAARAHRRTGAPVFTHTNGAAIGLEQQRLLADEGVDLGRVVVGHIDRTPPDELDKIEQLILNGSLVGFDSFGFRPPAGPPMEPDEVRLGWVADLCARGYAERIVLAHDQTAFSDLEPPELVEEIARERGTWTWLSDVGLGMLRELGVTDAQIDQMMVANPRRVFEAAADGGY